MKYYKATMDYRPDNPKKPQYYMGFKEDVSLYRAKAYFKKTYTWLKLYDCVEITEKEYSDYWERIMTEVIQFDTKI